MENTNDILTGLRVISQVPLNKKEYALNEATLIDLGPGDNLAYTYHKGLEVTCITERTKYEWKEMEIGDVGLLPSNFTYPPGLIVDGIDYSNKSYNFVKIESSITPDLQDLQSVLDTGNTATQIAGDTTSTINFYENSYEYIISQNLNPIRYSTSATINANTNSLSGYRSETNFTTGDQGVIKIDEGFIEFNQVKIVSTFDHKNIYIRFQEPVNENTILLFPTKESDGTYIIATLDDIVPSVDQNLESVLNVGNTVEYDNGNSIVQLLEGTAGNRESYIYSGDDDMSAGLTVIKDNVVITGYSPSGIIERQGFIQVNDSMPKLVYVIDANTSQKATTVEFNTPIISTGIRFPAKTNPGNYTLATLDDIPTIDGSETKLISGTTTGVTGDGKIGTPYKVEVKKLQKILTYPTDFPSGNYTLTNDDNEYLIFINNGANNVTITVPAGLLTAFFVAMLQEGIGDVAFVESGTDINPSVGLRIKGQNNVVALDKKTNTETFYLTGDNKV